MNSLLENEYNETSDDPGRCLKVEMVGEGMERATCRLACRCELLPPYSHHFLLLLFLPPPLAALLVDERRTNEGDCTELLEVSLLQPHVTFRSAFVI